MTNVTIFRKGKRPAGFEAYGHAGFADEGSDIVCSAVSALTQTAVIGLGDVAGINIAPELGEGSLRCMLPAGLAGQKLHDAELILETMASGLRSIADSYGDYINIEEREV